MVRFPSKTVAVGWDPRGKWSEITYTGDVTGDMDARRRRRRTCDHFFDLLFWLTEGHVPVLCRGIKIASGGCCGGGGVARLWLSRYPTSLAGKWYGGREEICGRKSGGRKRRKSMRHRTAFDPGLSQSWAGIGQKRVIQARNVEGECKRERHYFRELFVKKEEG